MTFIEYNKIIRTPKFNVYVLKSGDNTYDVLFDQKGNNPSNGSRLHQYDAEHTAVKAAEKFVELYQVALEHGYHLNGRFITKTGNERIHVSYAMDLDRSPDKFRALLQD